MLSYRSFWSFKKMLIYISFYLFYFILSKHLGEIICGALHFYIPWYYYFHFLLYLTDWCMSNFKIFCYVLMHFFICVWYPWNLNLWFALFIVNTKGEFYCSVYMLHILAVIINKRVGAQIRMTINRNTFSSIDANNLWDYPSKNMTM